MDAQGRAGEKITLYTFAMSPYGMKVYWALIYKRLAFDIVYVQPRSFAEVAFTGKRIVPILKIGEQWRADSTPICLWLEQLYPERPLMGAGNGENQAIMDADHWVSERLIAYCFRSVVDEHVGSSVFRNGVRLARIMKRTSGGIPWFAPLFWSRYLRKVAFAQREARKLDPEISLDDWRERLIGELSGRLEISGWLAGNDRLSLADVAAYAQIITSEAAGLEKQITGQSSPDIRDWLGRVQAQMPRHPLPELTPGWKLPDYRQA